jgi:hypothetical protein
MKIRLYTLIFLHILIGLLFIMLFWGGPDYYSNRSLKTIWDVGHIIFFALFTYVLLYDWKWIRSKKNMIQGSLILLITITLGLLIEVVQMGFDRRLEFGDILRNILGCMITLIFFSEKILFRKSIMIPLKVLLVFWLFLELLSPVRSIIDEVIANKQFPILVNFETPFEKYRWVQPEKIFVSKDSVKIGKAAGKTILTTEKYSGIFLKYFPRNWTNYQFLSFYIYNNSLDSLKITCRVFDDKHLKLNQKFSDRFNKGILLSPGWNFVKIPLSELKIAPKDREMDLSQIMNFGIFAKSLPSPVTIFIDEVRLE